MEARASNKLPRVYSIRQGENKRLSADETLEQRSVRGLLPDRTVKAPCRVGVHWSTAVKVPIHPRSQGSVDFPRTADDAPSTEFSLLPRWPFWGRPCSRANRTPSAVGRQPCARWEEERLRLTPRSTLLGDERCRTFTVACLFQDHGSRNRECQTCRRWFGCGSSHPRASPTC